MIIVAIIALAGVVLAALLVVFGSGLPSLPSSVLSMASVLVQAVREGAGVFWNFVHPAPVKAMLGLTIAFVLIYEAYKFVMWVVEKIPMFGVSD